MAILHLLHADGGFLCGDTEIGVADYSYPTSTYARRAKYNPHSVAVTIMAAESARIETTRAIFSTYPDLAERNARWLTELRAAHVSNLVEGV